MMQSNVYRLCSRLICTIMILLEIEVQNILRRSLRMAKTNYSYEKRGREIEKQKKQEEKRQKKLNKKNEGKKEEESETDSSSDDS